MMPRFTLAWMLLGVLTGAACAQFPTWPGWKCQANHCWCPNDYCKKPLPPAACAPTGCFNDYCKKPLPPVPCAGPAGCNDYCKKPLPPCPTIGSGWWYICGACQGHP